MCFVTSNGFDFLSRCNLKDKWHSKMKIFSGLNNFKTFDL